MKCDRDCFNCPFDDCIEDELEWEDYVALAELERDFIHPKTQKQKKVAAQKKAYYEANREQIAAQKKAYYEANREQIVAQQKAYREANREKYNQYMREYMRKRRLMKGEN